MVLVPLSGWLSDRVGHRRQLIAAFLVLIVATYPLFWLADQGTPGNALGAQLGFAVIFSGIFGPLAAVFASLFPTHLRFSGMALAYNLALAIFGGTTPWVATWLVTETGQIIAPAYYLMVMSLIGLLSAIALRSNQPDCEPPRPH